MTHFWHKQVCVCVDGAYTGRKHPSKFAIALKTEQKKLLLQSWATTWLHLSVSNITLHVFGTSVIRIWSNLLNSTPSSSKSRRNLWTNDITVNIIRCKWACKQNKSTYEFCSNETNPRYTRYVTLGTGENYKLLSEK